MNNNNPSIKPLTKVQSETSSFIHSIKAGEGEPVILIHGLAASLYDWVDLIPALSLAGYCSYAFDLPGHGNSHPPEKPGDYNIDFVYTKFYRWVNSLQLSRPVILIGHSLGGYLSLRFAHQFPDKIKALVLCAPFYSLTQLPFLLRLNYEYSLLDMTNIEKLPEWLIRGAVDLTSLSIRNGYELPKSIRKQTAADYKRANPGIFNILNSMDDLTPMLPTLVHTALLIWGSKDNTLSTKSFMNILKLLPDVKGAVIQGAGHVPHQSHSEEFNKMVIEFLHSLPLS